MLYPHPSIPNFKAPALICQFFHLSRHSYNVNLFSIISFQIFKAIFFFAVFGFNFICPFSTLCLFIILCTVLLPVHAENVLSSLKFCHYSSHCDIGNQTCSRKFWVIISIFFLPDHYLFPLSSNRIFLGKSSSPLKLLYMIQRYLYQLLSPRSLFDIVTTRHQIIWQQSFIREALDLS